jgi:hypothetical protein
LIRSPVLFLQFGEWIWKFPSKIRSVVALGVSAVIWAIWKTRNLAVFENVFPNDICSVVCRVSYWISNWSCLQKGAVRQGQVIVAQLLSRVATEAFGGHLGWAPSRKSIRF